MVALLAGITACTDDTPHEGASGVAIAIDNGQCADIAIGHTHILIYDTEGDLYADYDYPNAAAVAATLLPIEAGHYTIVSVSNADAELTEIATLTALHEWVAAQSAGDDDMLSGIADADVTENSIIRVPIKYLKGTFDLPTLVVRFTLPETGMPDFNTKQVKARAAQAGYTLRCVAELYKSGTDPVALHKVLTPELQEDGSYIAKLSMAEGCYDLHLWADYADIDTPLADNFYHTESLKAVTLDSPYRANTDAKDVAYGNETSITVSGDETSIAMSLQRPLAKYRFIVDDEEIKEYLRLKKANPKEFPPIEDLIVNVSYEGYFPSGFNAITGKPNDATTGITYTGTLAHYDSAASELEIGSDWIFVNGSSSFVNATVKVTDSNGKVICRIPGIQIDYRRNHLTTIKGRFLTSGANTGGINIDTNWDGIFDVWF